MSDSIKLDSYEPDYSSGCCNCGQSPTVTGVRHGTVVYESNMCGVCTFGTADAIDPEWWNASEEKEKP